MIIITGGIHRSGTTWLYNTVKNLFPSYRYCFYENIKLYNNTVYKSHLWHEEFSTGTSILITRDIRSVAASLFKFQPLKQYYNITDANIITVLERMIEQECEAWNPNLKLRYEDGKLFNTQKIIDYFSLDIDAQSHVQLIEEICMPSLTRDIHTELWPGHRTDSSMAELSTPLCDKISIKFGWWLEKHGYRI
jgi:hypothetical protein